MFLIVSWSKPEPYKRHITISVQGPACDLLVPVGIDIVDLPALRPDRPTTYKMASMYHTCVAPPRMNDDDIVTQESYNTRMSCVCVYIWFTIGLEL